MGSPVALEPPLLMALEFGAMPWTVKEPAQVFVKPQFTAHRQIFSTALVANWRKGTGGTRTYASLSTRKRLHDSQNYLISPVFICALPEACLAVENFSFWQSFEDPGERITTLEIMFEALSRRSKENSNSKIQTLAMHNLQNMPLDKFTSSPEFQDVTQHLQELHLHLCNECNEDGPDHDIFCIER
jgi:hypothetical protein